MSAMLLSLNEGINLFNPVRGIDDQKKLFNEILK